jgi:hypothetical protein
MIVVDQIDLSKTVISISIPWWRPVQDLLSTSLSEHEAKSARPIFKSLVRLKIADCVIAKLGKGYGV